MKNEKLRLNNQLCHRFYVVANAFARAYRPLLEPLDLTYPQYVSMMALWEHAPMTVSSLLEKTQIDAGAMTQMLKKLASKGFINLSPSETDRRVKIVSVTENGRQLKNKAASVPDGMACQLPGIKKNELKQMVDLVDKLKAELID